MAGGVVLYEGPSMLDGADIVCVATGLGAKSRNAKTGNMVQTWILRADRNPLEALATGADASVCGGCKHRPTEQPSGKLFGSCYVNVAQAPLAVWRAWKAGAYRPVKASDRQRFAGRVVRWGAYGDPAALPVRVIRRLTRWTRARTGYTHQWRTCKPALRAFLMASVDTLAEYTDAKKAGWRTFRVRAQGAPMLPTEVACPASPEGGNRRTCETCRACDGAKAGTNRDISIIVHGPSAKLAQFARVTLGTDRLK